jgi:hypothetical protein
LLRHPPAQVPARVSNANGNHEQLGKPCLLRRPCAEIGANRGDDLLLVFFDQRGKALEAVVAQRERWIGFASICVSLSVEQAS